MNYSLSITITTATAESSPRTFFAEHAQVPLSALVILRILRFPLTIELLFTGNLLNAFRHVTFGAGKPVALHCRLTFCPSSTVIDDDL